MTLFTFLDMHDTQMGNQGVAGPCPFPVLLCMVAAKFHWTVKTLMGSTGQLMGSWQQPFYFFSCATNSGLHLQINLIVALSFSPLTCPLSVCVVCAEEPPAHSYSLFQLNRMMGARLFLIPVKSVNVELGDIAETVRLAPGIRGD